MNAQWANGGEAVCRGWPQTNEYIHDDNGDGEAGRERAGGRAEVSAKSLKRNPGLAPSHANRMH